eukprot:305059_1
MSTVLNTQLRETHCINHTKYLKCRHISSHLCSILKWPICQQSCCCICFIFYLLFGFSMAVWRIIMGDGYIVFLIFILIICIMLCAAFKSFCFHLLYKQKVHRDVWFSSNNPHRHQVYAYYKDKYGLVDFKRKIHGWWVSKEDFYEHYQYDELREETAYIIDITYFWNEYLECDIWWKQSNSFERCKYIMEQYCFCSNVSDIVSFPTDIVAILSEYYYHEITDKKLKVKHKAENNSNHATQEDWKRLNRVWR